MATRLPQSDDCRICTEPFTEEQYPMVNECGHAYCSACAERVEECPFCRRSGTPHRLYNDAMIDDLADNVESLSLDAPIQDGDQLNLKSSF